MCIRDRPDVIRHQRQREVPAYQQLRGLEQQVHQEDDAVDQQAEQRRSENLLEDIPADAGHEGKGTWMGCVACGARSVMTSANMVVQGGRLVKDPYAPPWQRRP